ncbi:MAG: MXAN_6577-like cysteine-rich protein [Archangium sp.]|nr:MXAN_6577-like cysteine-rich protein [Archangium sp.]
MKQLTLISLAALTLLTACPPTGVVCKPGTLPCGTGCIDPNSDRRHCGSCGTACGAQQDCNSGTCECRPGSALCPDGTCANTDFDSKNCGSCGAACATGQVCEFEADAGKGLCKTSCSPGLLRCLASCVDSFTDESHCGGCDVVCAQGQQCKGGVCDYEAVAACYWSGQLVGFDPTTGVKGPLSDVGSNPAALARLGTTLLAADGTDRRLYTASPTVTGAYALGALASTTGAVPNQVLVDRPFVYVVNAGSGTLTVLREGTDAGIIRLDAGVEGTLTLGTVAEIALGMNSFPQGVAKLGAKLFVPTYGGYGADAADAGQELLKLDITDPAAPTLAGRASFKNLDLKAFDGGAPVARPWAVIAKGGALYVALNNLNPDTYAPEGPGLVARVDPTTDAVTVIDLGASDCLNPQWLGAVGDSLVVSCGGLITYSPTFSVESVTAAGVVVLDALDARLGAAWSSSGSCGVDAGACMPMMPGRFAVSGQQVLLSDQNGGRVVVLEVTDAGVREVRGGTAALNVCPVSMTTGVANVADIVSR